MKKLLESISKVWADKLQSHFEAVFGATQGAWFLHVPQFRRKKRPKWGSRLPFTTFAIGSLVVLTLIGATNAWAMDIPDANSAGAKLFSGRCSACHALPHPKRLDWQHWRHMLRVMKLRMAEQEMTMPDGEWHQIADYLKQHAR